MKNKTAILGVIDAFVLLSMDEMVFDAKYNGQDGYAQNRRYEQRQDRRYDRSNRRQDQRIGGRQPERYNRGQRPPVKRPVNITAKANPHKARGKAKYDDYDFQEAIVEFNKALEINPKDVAVHYNLASAYSITEEKEKAFQHLSKAVELGFKDFERIKNADALAYLRIQDEFDTFAKNGYLLQTTTASKQEEPAPEISEDLLDQIKRLGELREKGFLTQEEFLSQKRKLLR